MLLFPHEIKKSYERIKNYIHKTPLLTSEFLNQKIGHEIFFKCESFQKIGAFKFRGAINALLSYREKHGEFPKKIVAFSSGNHAQAVALAGKILNVPTRIYMAKFCSSVKIQATKSYGAEVILPETRAEAEALTKIDIEENGYYLIHPFNDNDVLLGQGTSCFEALSDIGEISAVFAPCGGGGLLSGTYLAKELLSPHAKIFGVEPELADDVFQSLKAGKIIPLEKPSMTIADGVRTPSCGDITFEYLKKLDGIIPLSEEKIIYWTQWLNHLLKVRIEPTSAMCMGGVMEYLKSVNTPQKILIILSGGNIDSDTELKLWEKDYLKDEPKSKKIIL